MAPKRVMKSGARPRTRSVDDFNKFREYKRKISRSASRSRSKSRSKSKSKSQSYPSYSSSSGKAGSKSKKRSGSRKPSRASRKSVRIRRARKSADNTRMWVWIGIGGAVLLALLIFGICWFRSPDTGDEKLLEGESKIRDYGRKSNQNDYRHDFADASSAFHEEEDAEYSETVSNVVYALKWICGSLLLFYAVDCFVAWTQEPYRGRVQPKLEIDDWTNPDYEEGQTDQTGSQSDNLGQDKPTLALPASEGEQTGSSDGTSSVSQTLINLLPWSNTNSGVTDKMRKMRPNEKLDLETLSQDRLCGADLDHNGSRLKEWCGVKEGGLIRDCTSAENEKCQGDRIFTLSQLPDADIPDADIPDADTNNHEHTEVHEGEGSWWKRVNTSGLSTWWKGDNTTTGEEEGDLTNYTDPDPNSGSSGKTGSNDTTGSGNVGSGSSGSGSSGSGTSGSTDGWWVSSYGNDVLGRGQCVATNNTGEKRDCTASERKGRRARDGSLLGSEVLPFNEEFLSEVDLKFTNGKYHCALSSTAGNTRKCDQSELEYLMKKNNWEVPDDYTLNKDGSGTLTYHGPTTSQGPTTHQGPKTYFKQLTTYSSNGVTEEVCKKTTDKSKATAFDNKDYGDFKDGSGWEECTDAEKNDGWTSI